ncbi:MAG: transcription elongation factor GreA [Candidatus Omnitrophica bacterium]|nr:transcription elongation factor GreA [Candidatus Omnitrophota bacterium]
MSGAYLTKNGYQKLMEELEYLKKTKRKEISKAIAEARAHGDISENSEFDAAKEAQAHNEARINQLESKLAGAHIIEDVGMSCDEVLIGATVKLKDLDTDEELEYTLVSEDESDYEQNKISITSPVGSGLLNRKINDVAEISVPAGKLRYKILSISRE